MGIFAELEEKQKQAVGKEFWFWRKPKDVIPPNRPVMYHIQLLPVKSVIFSIDTLEIEKYISVDGHVGVLQKDVHGEDLIVCST